MKIKYLVMDVDGTLTDGKIYMGNDGEVCKAFSVKDGCGIHNLLIPAGIMPMIITGRKSVILERRCKEIGITELYQGVQNKLEILDKILLEEGAEYTEVAYIGDDINDLTCMNFVKKGGGICGCPADATKKVKEVVDFISEKDGGDGAVREFIEWLLERQVIMQDE